MDNAMTPFIYLGIEIGKLKARLKNLTLTRQEYDVIQCDINSLTKMQNAIPEHRR